MALLMWVRHQLLWWPLHPIGYPIGAVWLMDQLWFSIALAWLLKLMAMKYGGPSLFRRAAAFLFGPNRRPVFHRRALVDYRLFYGYDRQCGILDLRKALTTMPKFAVRWMALGWILASAPLAQAEVDFVELAHTAPVERVQQTMDTFAGLGSRVAGYPGADQAAQIVQEHFRAIGLDNIAVHEYDVFDSRR